MSTEDKPEQLHTIEFHPILPDAGLLLFEECPKDFEIEKPKLLPLKSATQLRFEKLQHEADRLRKEKQKTGKQQ